MSQTFINHSQWSPIIINYITSDWKITVKIYSSSSFSHCFPHVFQPDRLSAAAPIVSPAAPPPSFAPPGTAAPSRRPPAACRSLAEPARKAVRKAGKPGSNGPGNIHIIIYIYIIYIWCVCFYISIYIYTFLYVHIYIYMKIVRELNKSDMGIYWKWLK